MKDNTLVSIITPVFNSERFMRQTIESVRNQTHTNWELLTIDDHSTDSSISILKEYSSQDNRIQVLQTVQNEGAGSARNLGIKNAKGNFIAFLDADDLWTPHKLKTQLDFMVANNCDVCFSSYQLMNEEGKLLPAIIEALPILPYKKLIKANYIGNLTGIYNADSLGKIYGSQRRKRQDWSLWLRAVKKAGKAMGVTEPLAFYRIRKSGVSGNKFSLIYYNFIIYREELGFSKMKSFLMMLSFVREHFFVKARQLKKIKTSD